MPEIWDPVTGAMHNADSYTIADGRTSVPLTFAPYGSVFVVFRQSARQSQTGEPQIRDA